MKCAGVAGGGAGSEDLLPGLDWLTNTKLEHSPPPSSCDLIDSLLAQPQLAEVKPLPPFTGYYGHVSINGISGHHFHAIAQRLPEENNNYPTQSGYGADHDVVSSSTCATDAETTELEDVKSFSLDATDAIPDSCAATCLPSTKLFDDNPKQDMYDISAITDFAAMISSAIADTTVPSQPEDAERSDSRESWSDIDIYLSSECNQHGEKIVPQDFAEFGLAMSPPPVQQTNHHSSLDFTCKQEYSKSQEFLQKTLSQSTSALESILAHSYMPLLHDRLQNGPTVKQEAPSSTSYGMDGISTSSPPGNVVSTTNGVGRHLNGRYSHYSIGLKHEDLCSPERILGYPHAHTTTATPATKKRSRAKAKHTNNNLNNLAFPAAASAEMNHILNNNKEKPIHRCSICNRGFLNKSNIKVHLRTHTGEKPFRCDVCSKAFRQKAHLLKHQQIHKRIGRD